MADFSTTLGPMPLTSSRYGAAPVVATPRDGGQDPAAGGRVTRLAVQALHRGGMTHSDVRPGIVMLHQNGGRLFRIWDRRGLMPELRWPGWLPRDVGCASAVRPGDLRETISGIRARSPVVGASSPDPGKPMAEDRRPVSASTSSESVQ